LAGLLHGLGRLYVVMRAEEMAETATIDIREVAASWQATIGKAILESWGLPEPLQHAVEHQDDHEQSPIDAAEHAEPGVPVGVVTLTHVQTAEKILAARVGSDEMPPAPPLARPDHTVYDGDAATPFDHA